jgi:glutamate-1-semialdehyde 2,1-aminomutase
MQEYAIKDYLDVKKTYADIDNLMSYKTIKIKEEKMNEYLKYFEDKCNKSQAIINEAKEYIPGGVQHNLAFNFPFPLAINKAKGSYLYDVDGNKYIDFLQAGGPTILGSNNDVVRNKVIELLNDCGPSTGLFHEYELKLAKEINKHMPAVEKFRMLGSGTEAVMASLRIARLATSHKRIIKIGGAYHGWSDQMIYSTKAPRTKRMEAGGIPRQAVRYTDEAMPNDIKSLKRVLRRNTLRGGTAAVLIEPVGPESGTRPVDIDYNKQVRDLCDKYGALLIFDEVVTGFRIGLGGAQGFYDVIPDLTIFGKIIAGGYPGAGGVGGKKEYINLLAAGLKTGGKKAYSGGTLAATPLSSLAGYYTIKEIEKTNACVIAGQQGDKLTEKLKDLVKKYDLPFVVYNQGSICHLETVGGMFIDINYLHPFKTLKQVKQIKERKKNMEKYGAAYMAEGIVTLAGSRLYTSLATSDEVIEEAIKGFENVFKNIDRETIIKQ